MQNRQNALNKWLEGTLIPPQFSITSLTGDASFRRYFRLYHDDTTRIIMDAPPDRESIESFLAIASLLSSAGIHTPKLYALNKEQGFAVFEDFGDMLLLAKLNPQSVNKLYTAAIDTLITMQKAATETLPFFDKQFILYELNIFREWFLSAYLKINLSQAEEMLLNETFDWLSDQLLQQPQVFIHRDYHSRNIMILNDEPEFGIIDFQDAMNGPLTYDLVSLLKDCYIQWPREQVMAWLSYFYEHTPLAQQYSFADFARAFDYCGLQRHLKVLGVFSRLYLRDNKPNYLQDLPLTLHYVMACLEGREELHDFYQFMHTRIRLP
ncbi:putative phosphotransferase related to Ser/Thr protein kinases [Legionella massiliensis]|uniref:Putative phosphotransferase related to Ser/Thr protein kinases n=1 Tax=Legionella massiliensis TaxID=1034943 RepID=A0A078KU06_9GAMM|nr:phosphotransferase [Legionella massiliensis]CDZ76526.1 putative phosphotransferase related to Ser/Thr protein kinases [Legionella massiliensis]CEE12264.1 Phosphotransferase enzyme family protein [Legionella massiliensis]